MTTTAPGILPSSIDSRTIASTSAKLDTCLRTEECSAKTGMEIPANTRKQSTARDMQQFVSILRIFTLGDPKSSTKTSAILPSWRELPRQASAASLAGEFTPSVTNSSYAHLIPISCRQCYPEQQCAPWYSES